jgi:hypothetical protein
VVEPGLQQIDHAAGLDAIAVKLAPWQARIIHHARRRVALMLEVVYGEDCRRAAERRVAQRGVQHHRQQAGGPVVAVDDVGRPVELLAQRQRAAAQEGKAPVVVVAGTPGPGVNLGPREMVVILQEIHRHRRGSRTRRGRVRQHGLPGARPLRDRADIHAERRGQRAPLAHPLHRAVGGADDAHVVAELGELLGQRADHVG